MNPTSASRLKTEIVFPAEAFRQVATHLLHLDPIEQLAFVFAEACQNHNDLRLLVKEFWLSEPAWYETQSSTTLRTTNDLMRQVLGKVAATKASLIEIHSHPTSEYDVTFSMRDEASEFVTFPYVASRIPDIFHATMVMGRYSLDAHLWDRRAETVVPVQAVRIVGYPLGYVPTTSSNHSSAGADINSTGIVERASTEPWGADLGLATTWHDIREIEDLCVGIAGSTTATIETLADRLLEGGFRRFIKLSVPPEADFSHTLDLFKQLDILVSVTNDMTLLSQLNRLSLQYYIPYIALVSRAASHTESTLCGGIFVVLPGLPCLACQEVIPARQNPPHLKEGLIAPDIHPAVIARGAQEVLNLARPSSMPRSLHWDSSITQFNIARMERRSDCLYCAR
jgi:hypothetical protein